MQVKLLKMVENMTYHVQQKTQQKSIGILIVIAFHVLLIWGLANGLGVHIGQIFTPENLKLTPQQQTSPPPEKIHPEDVIIPTTKPLTFKPLDNRELTFEEQVIVRKDSGESGGVIERPAITKPRLIRATKPDYPISAARLGEEGTTGLSLYVTTDGRVAEAKVFVSSGSTALDNAAIKHALRQWAFTPCMEGDKAVACWHQTKLVWRLEDAKR